MEEQQGRARRVVHVMTVPLSLSFFRGQARFMRERGLELSFVAAPGAELARFSEEEDAVTCAVPMERRITPLRDLVAVWRLVRLLRRVRPDIVHSHTPKGGLLGMIAGFLAGIPVRVYHLRGLPLETASGARRVLLRWTERVACALAHRVIAVSHSLRQVALRERLCAPERIKVLLQGSGDGVDVTTFDPQAVTPAQVQALRARYGIPADATVIGFVGRIVRDKGVVELARAWRGLRERHPAAHLLLVGAPEEGDPVPPELLEELERDPRAHFTGHFSEMPLAYAAMDVLALPTYREGFPNALLEAGAMERPVVAAAASGCVDAVEDGLTGLLVPVADAPALEAALDRYLGDPQLRRAHALAARGRILREFRRELLLDALFREYEQLLGAADHRPAPRALPGASG